MPATQSQILSSYVVRGSSKIRYYASSGTLPVRSGAYGAVAINKKQYNRHSRENGNPSGVGSSSCVFWIPVFTGMTVVVVYRSNLQKIVSHATVRTYASHNP